MTLIPALLTEISQDAPLLKTVVFVCTGNFYPFEESIGLTAAMKSGNEFPHST